MPVKTVVAPPSAKRITYSYQRPSRSEDGDGVDRRFVPQKLKEGIVRRPPLFLIDRKEMAQDFDGLASCRKGLGHKHGQNPQHLFVAQLEQLREQLGKVDRAVFRRAQVTLARQPKKYPHFCVLVLEDGARLARC
jgi:hypothetical protein